MEHLSWGSPLGIGLCFLLMGLGMAAFLWGLAQLCQAQEPKSPQQ